MSQCGLGWDCGSEKLYESPELLRQKDHFLWLKNSPISVSNFHFSTKIRQSRAEFPTD